MKPPFEKFLEDALKEFEQDRKNKGLRQQPVDHRMRGARQFVRFLLGHPPDKGERTKD